MEPVLRLWNEAPSRWTNSPRRRWRAVATAAAVTAAFAALAVLVVWSAS